MGRKPRHQYILDKSKEAALAAISCYNQPNLIYREEIFCVLMVNAWELLLKAKIVKDNSEKIISLYIKDDQAKRKDAKPLKNPKYKKNKAGNYITIDFRKILNSGLMNIDHALKLQLETLYELRNQTSHYVSEELKKSFLGVFTATLQSYCKVYEDWFEQKISDGLFLIPLAFSVPDTFATQVNDKQTENLLRFISKQENSLEENSEHSIRLGIKLKFERKKDGISVNLDKENGIPIVIDSEENFQNKYPWNYKDHLIPKLKQYSNFSQNGEFHKVKKELEKDENLCGERYLDWNKKKGTRKKFYSPNILEHFEHRLGLKK